MAELKIKFDQNLQELEFLREKDKVFQEAAQQQACFIHTSR